MVGLRIDGIMRLCWRSSSYGYGGRGGRAEAVRSDRGGSGEEYRARRGRGGGESGCRAFGCAGEAELECSVVMLERRSEGVVVV